MSSAFGLDGTLSSSNLAAQTSQTMDLPQSSTLTESTKAWRSRVARMPEIHRKLFLEYEKRDLGECLSAVKANCQRLQNESRARRVLDFFKPLFIVLNNFMPAAATISQAHPNPSSLVLGGLMCILQNGLNFLSYHDRVIEAIEDMENQAKILERFSEDVYATEDEVQLALVNVYSDILDFCSEVARTYINEKGERRKSLAIWTDSVREKFSENLKPILRNFNTHVKNYHAEAEKFEKRTTKTYREELLKDVRMQSRMLMQHFKSSEEQKDILLNVNQTLLGIRTDAEHRMIGNVQSRFDKERKEQDERLRAKRFEVLKWIPSFSFETFHEKVTKERLAGTGTWLLNNSEFENWKTTNESPVLWVKGKHGCGKTFLAGRIIEYLECLRDTQDESIAVSYVYLSALDGNARTLAILLWALIEQLCEQTDELDKTLEDFYNRTGHKKPDRSVTQGKKVFDSMLMKFKKTFVVIDGLDESPDHMEIARYFADVADTYANCKPIVFSRPEYPDIQKSLGRFQSISVDSGNNSSDIIHFISEVMADFDFDADDHERLGKVHDLMLDKADGMFLWVTLFANGLKLQQTESQVEAYLCEFPIPGDLNRAYELAFGRIDSLPTAYMKEVALNVILWTVNAGRPLSEDEMRDAVLIKPGSSEIRKKDRILKKHNMASWCADLVEVDRDGRYRLVHSSLQDYLRSLGSTTQSILEKYRLKQDRAEFLLAEACMTYLLFSQFSDEPLTAQDQVKTRIEKHPFATYAARFCRYHLRRGAEEESKGLISSLVNCLNARDFYLQLQFMPMDRLPLVRSSTPLHIISALGLLRTAKLIPGLLKYRAIKDSAGFYPLDYAFLSEDKDMCLWLLDGLAGHSATTTLTKSVCRCLIDAASLDWPEVIDRLMLIKNEVNHVDGTLKSTALIEAARQGSNSSLERLLLAGGNVDLSGHDNDIPLVAAAAGNHESNVISLVLAGAFINATGLNGYTALHASLQNKNLSILNFLLKNGADVHAGIKGWGSWTPLHEAARRDWAQGIQLLFAYGALTNSETADKITPAFTAADLGGLEALEELVALGARLDARNTRDETTLHVAARSGHSQIVRYLIMNGVDVDSTDWNGYTPLHDAAINGRSDVVDILLKSNARVDAINSFKDTPLYSAIKSGNTEVAEALLRGGASPCMRGWNGYEALHHAAQFGLDSLIDRCLDCGATVDRPNDLGVTALHIAARHGKLQFVQTLLDTGRTISVNATDERDQTPLHHAALNGNLEVIEYLMSRGALITGDINLGRPIHNAAMNGHISVVQYFVRLGELSKSDRFGRTALHHASLNGRAAVVAFLISSYADVNAADDYGLTALCLALKGGHDDLAQTLLDEAANATLLGKNSKTALHYAAEIGNESIVKQLLALGCRGQQLDTKGRSPLYFAVQGGHSKVFDMLMERNASPTKVPDINIQSCLAEATIQGNIKMLEALVDAGVDVRSCVDVYCSAFSCAIANGEFEAAKFFLRCGLTWDDLKNAPSNPLRVAAFGGHHGALKFILEALPDADCDKLQSREQTTPLLLSTKLRHAKCVRTLVRSNADPYKCDAFGFNSLDYACTHSPTFQAIGRQQIEETPLRTLNRRRILATTILSCLRELAFPPVSSQLYWPVERVEVVRTLTSAIRYCRSFSDYYAVKLCFMDCHLPADMLSSRGRCICDICHREMFEEDYFICTTCADVQLCGSCFRLYQEGPEPRSGPRSLRILDKLENRILGVMSHMQHIIHLGLDALTLTTQYNFVKNWFQSKSKEYDAWETKYNLEDFFQFDHRHGKSCVRLFHDLLNINEAEERQQGTLSSDKDERTHLKRRELDRQFIQVRKTVELQQEHSDFVCSDHEYIHVSLEECRDLRRSGEVLDTDGKLTRSWLLSMIEKYEAISAELNDSTLESKNKGVESRSNSTDDPEAASGSNQASSSTSAVHLKDSTSEKLREPGMVRRTDVATSLFSLVDFAIINMAEEIKPGSSCEYLRSLKHGEKGHANEMWNARSELTRKRSLDSLTQDPEVLSSAKIFNRSRRRGSIQGPVGEDS